jgi:ABC-type sugar transport system permease subunit
MASGALRRNMIGYGFVFPWLIALVVFIGMPFLAGFYFSFCDYPPLRSPVWVGLDNYHEMLGDAHFWQAMGVTVTYGAVAIPIGVCLAITLAMFLNARIRGQTFYRVVFYIPFLVPTVVVAILWMWIYNPEFGLLNIVLKPLLSQIDRWTSDVWLLNGRWLGEWGWLAQNLGGFGEAAGLGAVDRVRHAFGALVAIVVSGAALIGPLVLIATIFSRESLKLRPKLHRFLKFAAGLGVVLAVIVVLYALLGWMFPADLKRLHSPSWLADGTPLPSALPFAPPLAMWSLIIMSMWAVGQMAVIYLAKLQDVPSELYEAAEIDGASWAQKTWNVTIPMITPVILFNVIMAIIGEFQVFVEPYIMTLGGPEYKTRFIAMFVYDQAFRYQRVGYASAVAFVLFLMIVALTVTAFSLIQKRVYYAAR